MADTLLDIRDQLKFRLGDLEDDGTWGKEEANRQIYNAERKVCEDTIVNRNALLPEVYYVNLIEGKYKYLLPADFISPLHILQYHNGVHYVLSSANIAMLLDGFDPTATSDILTNYCVRGQAPNVLVEGVATGGSNTALANADLSTVHGFDVAAKKITTSRDYIENIQDNSSSLITTITDANNLVLSGLEGGARNAFRLGDEYKIYEEESTRRLLYVYPVPGSTDTTLQSSITSDGDTSDYIGQIGAASVTSLSQSFTVDTAVSARKIDLYIASETGTTIGDANVRIETDTAGSPSGTLVDELASCALKEPATGWDSGVFLNKFQLAASTTYHILFQIQAQANGNGLYWSKNSTDGYLYRLYGSTGNEGLMARYARYPFKMVDDKDQSELPQYAGEARFLWAMYLCYQKVYGIRSGEAEATRVLYEAEIQKIKERLRDEQSGRRDYVRDAMGWFGSSGEPTHNNVPLGVTLPLS